MNGFEMILPFLKPIEHLILDDSISEVMVNGADHVFIEKQGFLQQVPGVTLGREIPHGRRQEHCPAFRGRHLGIETDSRLALARWQPRRCGDPAVQSWRRNAHDPQVQHPALRDGRPHSRRNPESCAREPPRRLCPRAQEHPHCGGTGSGKTTLASILGKFIPADERILVIEDTAEIQLTQDNLVRFEARREQNGLPAVAIRDLLKAALRHRPDRIILGEIRGGEAFDLLQLLNTGHSGTLSTIHANFGEARIGKVHELRPAKRCRSAVPRDQNEHRRLAQRCCSSRAAAWT